MKHKKILVVLFSFISVSCGTAVFNPQTGQTFDVNKWTNKPTSPSAKIDNDNFYIYAGEFDGGQVFKKNKKWTISTDEVQGGILVKNGVVAKTYTIEEINNLVFSNTTQQRKSIPKSTNTDSIQDLKKTKTIKEDVAVALNNSQKITYVFDTFEGIWSEDCDNSDVTIVWKKVDNENYKLTYYFEDSIFGIADAYSFKKTDTNKFSFKFRQKKSSDEIINRNIETEFINKNERKVISNSSDDGTYFVKDGIDVKTNLSFSLKRCKSMRNFQVIDDSNSFEKYTIMPNKRERVKDLERELKSLSDDYNWDIKSFMEWACYGWQDKKYLTYEACKADNDFNSLAWENHLKTQISIHKKNRMKKLKVAENRERCLSNGPIGICQSSKQSEMMYLCGTNLITGLQNIANPYCYVNDDTNIIAKMEVRNNTSQAIKDVSFVCEQIANSGTVLSKNTQTVYDRWNPGEIKLVTLKFFKQNQVNNLRCNPTNWKNY